MKTDPSSRLVPLEHTLSAPFLRLEPGVRVALIHNHVSPWRRLACLPAAILAGVLSHWLWGRWIQGQDSLSFSAAVVVSLAYVGIVAVWLWQMLEPERALIHDAVQQRFEIWSGRLGLLHPLERIPEGLVTGIEIETTRCCYCNTPVSRNSERIIHGTDVWLTLRDRHQVFCGEFSPQLAEQAVGTLRSIASLQDLPVEHADGPLLSARQGSSPGLHCGAGDCVRRAGQDEALRDFDSLPATT